MFNPYENIIIGNFIYSLGLAMGRQARPVDGCINLLQQTPADPALGDLMLQFPGVWRLIEFKRHGGDDQKEHAKQKMFLAFTDAARGKAHLRRISRQVHWYMRSGPSDPQAVQSGFCMQMRPYLEPGHPGTSMEAFVRELVDQACRGQFTDSDELGDYMALVKTFAGVRRFNAGGLLVGVSGGAPDGSGGGISYLPVPNFADLRSTARMLHERYLEAAHQRSVTQELGARRDTALSASRAREQTRAAPSKGWELSR